MENTNIYLEAFKNCREELNKELPGKIDKCDELFSSLSTYYNLLIKTADMYKDISELLSHYLNMKTVGVGVSYNDFEISGEEEKVSNYISSYLDTLPEVDRNKYLYLLRQFRIVPSNYMGSASISACIKNEDSKFTIEPNTFYDMCNNDYLFDEITEDDLNKICLACPYRNEKSEEDGCNHYCLSDKCPRKIIIKDWEKENEEKVDNYCRFIKSIHPEYTVYKSQKVEDNEYDI